MSHRILDKGMTFVSLKGTWALRFQKRGFISLSLPGAGAAAFPLLTSNGNPHRRLIEVVVDISTWLLSFFPHICVTRDPKTELRTKLFE